MSILAAAAQQIVVNPARPAPTPWWTIILTQIGVILGASLAAGAALWTAKRNRDEERRQRLRDRRIDAAAGYGAELDRFRTELLQAIGPNSPADAQDQLLRVVMAAQSKRTFVRILFDERSRVRAAAFAVSNALADAYEAADAYLDALEEERSPDSSALDSALGRLSDRQHEFITAAGAELARA